MILPQPSSAAGSSLFATDERYTAQKKKTTLMYSTLSAGGTRAMFTAVAGIHSFQFASIVGL